MSLNQSSNGNTNAPLSKSEYKTIAAAIMSTPGMTHAKAQSIFLATITQAGKRGTYETLDRYLAKAGAKPEFFPKPVVAQPITVVGLETKPAVGGGKAKTA